MERIAQIFREEKARIVASLCRFTSDLDLAEDCFSEALEAALKDWPDRGTPHNPGAWLRTVARRKALDRFRRDTVLQTKLPSLYEDEGEGEAEDERLSLIFTCCHPALAADARIALTLRTLGGLTTPEIARAFLVPEATMAQRIVRAQRKIRDAGIPYRIPPPELLEERLDGVLAVLYLIFNESYQATGGPELVRVDLSREAIRLGQMLTDLMPQQAEPLGLLSLMRLQHSRLAARVSPAGELVTLEEQDRSLWDRVGMELGLGALEKASRLGRPGPYQIQAAIAAMHCRALTAAETDWGKICLLYDTLLRMLPSAIVELNRAVAVAMATRPEAGLELLEPLLEPLQDYAPFHAVQAELLQRAGRSAEAAVAYRRYLALEQNGPALAYAERRLRAISPF